MGSKYSSISVSGYNSGAPADDGTQTASNLVKWSTHKTKLGDPLNTAIASINSALVSALDNSARSISANDSAVAGDNARTLEVTGTTTVTLMLAATAGAGYWVNIVNAGSNTVTVAPTATDTVDGVASSFTLPAGTARALVVNSGLTGYNTFASYNISKNHTVQGTLAVTGTTTLSAALTYGGVTLSNSVTGTGSMMLSASPTTTGTLTAAAINASGLVAMAGNATVGGTLGVTGDITASSGVVNLGAGNGLVQTATNGVAEFAINFVGYAGGTTQFRNFTVYDGKNASIFSIVGSSKTATFQGAITAVGTTTLTSLAGAGSRAVNADASGVLSAASDSRLKSEVKDAVLPGLAEVLQLQPRAYKWLDDIEKRKDEAAVEVGFFANEVAEIIPSAAPMGNDGYYGFYDRSVTAALVNAVKELAADFQAYKAAHP